MSDHVVIYAVVTVLALWLAVMLAWTRTQLAIRWAGVVVALAIVVTAYPAVNKVLSYPRSANQEWWANRDTETTLIGAYVREGFGIDLWVLLPQSPIPRYYTLPWDENSREFVKKLMEAMQQAKKDGTKVKLKGMFDYDMTLERENPITPSPDPIPRFPDKDMFQEPVIEFDA